MTGNLLPSHSSERYEMLKADIAANGQTHPAAVDETGAIVDGFHRARICEELGVPLKTVKYSFASQANRDAAALRLNTVGDMSPERRKAARREEKRVYMALRQEGLTQERAAAAVGVAQPTGAKWEAAISNITGDKADTPPDKRTKLAPADKEQVRQRADAGESQKQIAADLGVSQARISQIVNTEPQEEGQAVAEPATKELGPRALKLAHAEKERVITAVGQLTGISRAMNELDEKRISSVSSTDEIKQWTETIDSARKALNKFKGALLKECS